MNEITFFHGLVIGWFVLSVVVFISLFFIAAPYGRHNRRGWGATINNRLGWIIMEAQSPILFAVFYFTGSNREAIVPIIFLLMWEVHYVHRAFVYPYLLKKSPNGMPLSIIGMGCFFNVINAYLNGRYIFSFSTAYSTAWLTDIRFIVGLLLFVLGFIINRQADYILDKLRKDNIEEYKIPYGGMYNLISCPNYLGEMIIWLGWAVATWSLPALAFFVWTAANLVPRARSHHMWYHQQFADYPEKRKALLPGIW